MLRANTENLSYVFHIVKEVGAKDLGTTLRGIDQTCQHRDSCGFTSAVMSEEGENLAVVHFDIEASDRLEPVIESLHEILNLENLLIGLHLLKIATHWLELARIHILGLKVRVILLLRFTSDPFLCHLLFVASPAPEARGEAEAPAFP